jgi:hypothetical protein
LAAKSSQTNELLGLHESLFGKKANLDSLNQDLAEQFAPDLAEFTTTLPLGYDFAADVMDAFPIILARDLSNAIGAHMRPDGKQWFRASTGDADVDARPRVRRFLEMQRRDVHRGVYKPKTRFKASTSEADRFYAITGQAVISVGEAPQTRDHLFFQNFHVKDCVWLENELGEVDHLQRRAKMSARVMKKRFGARGNLHQSVLKAALKAPNEEFDVAIITMPREEYEGFSAGRKSDAPEQGKLPKGQKLEFVRCYIDKSNEQLIQTDYIRRFDYAVPRWARLMGTQYAFSPAAMTALPDARMAQMLSQIILEAGEKGISPPLIARQESVIGGPSIEAGGISWVDIEGDGKLSDVLAPLNLDPDMRVGFEMRQDLREMLSRAFFIDKLTLPEAGKQMTAYETARRLEEHSRALLPLIGPMQSDYNVKLLDLSYETLVDMKQVDFMDMPDEMEGVDFTWTFETPIQENEQRLVVERFLESLGVIGQARELGLSSMPIDLDRATAEAISNIGVPTGWQIQEEQRKADAEHGQQVQQLEKTVMDVGAVAGVAEQVGKAGQELGMIAPPGGAGQAGGAGQPVPAEGQSPIDMAAAGGTTGNNVVPFDPSQLGGMDMGNQEMTEEQMRELRGMFRRMETSLATAMEALTQPREIELVKDKSGKITGARSAVAGKKRERDAA